MLLVRPREKERDRAREWAASCLSCVTAHVGDHEVHGHTFHKLAIVVAIAIVSQAIIMPLGLLLSQWKLAIYKWGSYIPKMWSRTGPGPSSNWKEWREWQLINYHPTLMNSCGGKGSVTAPAGRWTISIYTLMPSTLSSVLHNPTSGIENKHLPFDSFLLLSLDILHLFSSSQWSSTWSQRKPQSRRIIYHLNYATVA